MKTFIAYVLDRDPWYCELPNPMPDSVRLCRREYVFVRADAVTGMATYRPAHRYESPRTVRLSRKAAEARNAARGVGGQFTEPKGD